MAVMHKRDRDLRIVAEHVLMHRENPQAEAMRGNTIQWAYIRTMDRILRGWIPDVRVDDKKD